MDPQTTGVGRKPRCCGGHRRSSHHHLAYLHRRVDIWMGREWVETFCLERGQRESWRESLFSTSNFICLSLRYTILYGESSHIFHSTFICGTIVLFRVKLQYNTYF
jgi:hypothetical protein